MDQVHEAAIERHKHYARLNRKLPSKLERAVATGSYRRYRVAETEPVRDGHSAVQARRGLRERFL